MLKVFKPFALPTVLYGAEVGLGMTNYHSDFWGGVLIGAAFITAVMALFGNKPLLKKFPWILDFMPFLDPTGGVRSDPKELTATFLSGHSFEISILARDGKIIGRQLRGLRYIRASGASTIWSVTVC